MSTYVFSTANVKGFRENLEFTQPDVAIAFWEHISLLPPAWEKWAKEVVLVFPRTTEYRQYEDLKRNKYAIHVETFPGGLEDYYQGNTWNDFINTFLRQHSKDAKDTRKAIRMATKVFARQNL